MHRVISTQRTTARVLCLQDDHILNAFFSRQLKPVCGDFVSIESNGDEHRITEILPRTGCFARSNSKGEQQIIAANVDQLVIVMAVEPAPTRDIINRYLVAAEIGNIEAVLVFNKIDLDVGFFKSSEKLYSELGYRCIQTSARHHRGMDEFDAALMNRTSVIVGQSGVGKSSLSRLILDDDSLKTRALSSKTGKGAHTTSVATLYPIPELNAWLIDSPGVWEFGLWKMDATDIAYGFREFRPFAAHCRFSNCTHLHEPGCAVKAAVESSEVLPSRHTSYARIVESLKHWK